MMHYFTNIQTLKTECYFTFQTIVLSLAISLTALYFEGVAFFFVVVIKGLAVSDKFTRIHTYHLPSNNL